MPADRNSDDPSNSVEVQPGTKEAEALCFLYANSDLGFKPAKVGENTSIPSNSADKVLSQLSEKDLVGKTHDGYYHALDAQEITQHADRLGDGESFRFDTGREDYPDDIDETTTGFPEDDVEPEIVDGETDPEAWAEPYPEDA